MEGTESCCTVGNQHKMITTHCKIFATNSTKKYDAILGSKTGVQQGWEFAHRFSQQIARFLPKNEQMRDLLKKMSDSLIR